MAQNNIVMAFRKRMKRFGYHDITIKHIKGVKRSDIYQVSAIEPLSGVRVSVVYNDCYQMSRAFRIIRHQVAHVYSVDYPNLDFIIAENQSLLAGE